MKKLLVKLAFKVLTYYNISYIIYTPQGTSTISKAVFNMVQQVENKFKDQSGEFKRHQVLRAMMNIAPKARERDIALEIEWAVRKLD